MKRKRPAPPTAAEVAPAKASKSSVHESLRNHDWAVVHTPAPSFNPTLTIETVDARTGEPL